MDTQSKPRSPMSEVQRRKLMELYHGQHKGITEQSVIEGLDLLFQGQFKHPMSAASYEEGAHITAVLLNQQKVIPSAPPAPQPEAPAQPAPIPSAQVAPAIEFTEAPFSWNVTAEAPDGWNEQFTVRATESDAFLKKIERVKKYLTEHEYRPATRGGKPQAANAPAMETGEAAPICAIHKTPMQKRQSKNGTGFFWSCNHKLEDDSWCPYRPPKGTHA